MKKYILFLSILGMVAFGATSVSAQCDPNVESPIKCGYYTEGYQDALGDASAGRSNDHRRYRSKFNAQYQPFYQNGYQAGYAATSPGIRWTNSQRSAYNSGYTIGQNDRRRSGQGRSSESYGGQYDQSIGLYFQQGYSDGFDNRPRLYDVPLTGVPPVFPPGGVGTGSAQWSGRVDDRANIIIRGGTIFTENISGNGTQTINQSMSGALPRRPTTISASKSSGRGSVSVIQQPNRSNNFTGIVQVYDSGGGADNYRIDITWNSGALVEETFRSGSVTWRGRVDQTVQIKIAGSDVQSLDISGTGLSNVNASMNGYLANRPGSVTVRKRSGRGTVNVLEQPSRFNDFTATIQIFDPSGGADNYEIDITW